MTEGAVTPEMVKAGLSALRNRLLASDPVGAFTNVYTAMKALDPEIARLRAIAEAAHELVTGGLMVRGGNVPRLSVVEKSDNSDPHYRLCTLLESQS